MNKNDPVRLLILEESQNRAEELIVLLRTAGRATRAHQIESLADLNSKLNEQTWDLLLARKEANDVTVEQAINVIQKAGIDVPVIIIADDRNPDAILEGLKLGAQDVALADDTERLVLLTERELRNLEDRRQLKKAEVELRDTERRNSLLLDSTSAAIAYVHEGMHIYTNAAYSKLFGYDDPDDFAGIPVIDLISSDDQGKFKEFLRSYENNSEDAGEFTCVASDGSKVLTNMNLSPATYDGEECTQILILAVSQGKEEPKAATEERVTEVVSNEDSLTGLYNRQYFSEQLEDAVKQAKSGKPSFVLLYVIVDHFSRIRSEAGMTNADKVLAEIAGVIRKKVDKSHMMARFGDDVFTILFKSDDKEAASKLAEDIRSTIEGHMCEVDGKSYRATVSIGISSLAEDGGSSEDVISHAHRAGASIEDGNGVNFYQPEQVTVGEEGKSITSEHIKDLARNGIKNNTLKLLFQPVISLQGEEDEQFEVLLRLPDEDGNELTPSQFMGPVEDANLLEKMDRWIILTAVKMLADKRAEGHKSRAFINISHKSLSDDTFFPWLSVALKAAKLPSDAIILQFNETDANAYVKHAAKFATGAAEVHCRTSINHFGCTPNPLNLLKHLKPDFVKLDGSFAENIDDNKDKQSELSEMVQALQSQGILTAVSGVESPNALAALFQAGVNYIQGYYVSPPIENMDYDFGEDI